MNIQAHKAQKSPDRFNTKSTSLRHIIIKPSNIKERPDSQLVSQRKNKKRNKKIS